MVAPIVTIYNDFKTFRDANVYELAHGPEVYSIEAVLNDKWDAGMRRIRIKDGIREQPFWAGNDANNDSDYAGNDGDADLDYAPNEALLLDGSDAIIEVPSFIVFDLAEMKALIDKYRFAGKHNYKIVIV